MALSLRSLFGAGMSKAPLRGEAELDVPTTQVKMSALQPDHDALAKGGTVKDLAIDASTTDEIQMLLTGLSSRWERVEKNATAIVDNQAALLSLSKGLEGINQGNNALLELAQQASSQIAAG